MDRLTARQRLIETINANIRDETITLSNISSRYLELGAGKTVLLIHGMTPAGSLVWHDVMSHLAEQYHVIAPDLPGFGETVATGDFGDRSHYVGWLAEFLNTVGLENVHLVATSFSGAIALECCLQHPERIDKLVLVNASGFDQPPASPRFVLRAIANNVFASRMTLRWLAGYLMHNRAALVSSKSDSWSAFESYVVEVAKTRRRFMMRNFQPQSVAPLPADRLRQITHPTMLLWGEVDPLFGLSHAQRGAAMLPNARLETLPEVGHLPYLEQPEAFCRVVIDFLS